MRKTQTLVNGASLVLLMRQSADAVTHISTMRILDRCLDDNNSVLELGAEAVSYNDLPETTYIDIIRLVDKAIERM